MRQCFDFFAIIFQGAESKMKSMSVWIIYSATKGTRKCMKGQKGSVHFIIICVAVIYLQLDGTNIASKLLAMLLNVSLEVDNEIIKKNKVL